MIYVAAVMYIGIGQQLLFRNPTAWSMMTVATADGRGRPPAAIFDASSHAASSAWLLYASATEGE